VTGPIDVVQNHVTGILSENLCDAASAALQLDGRKAKAYALQHTWERATTQFFYHLAINENAAEVESMIAPKPLTAHE